MAGKLLVVFQVEFNMSDDYAVHALNFHLIAAILAAAFGSGFQHGYNTGVLNEIQNITMEWIRGCDKMSGECDNSMVETTFIWAWIVSMFCLGGFAGGLAVGVAAAACGRKNSLLANNVFVFLGGGLMFSARGMGEYAMLVAGRFFIGAASGVAAGLTPMYLSEISPSSLRGAIGTVYQLVITCSILVSQVLGVKYMLGSSSLWPHLLGLTVIPGVLQLLTLPWCPESPSYLFMNKKDREGAERALMWLRSSTDVSLELEDLQRETDEQDGEIVTLRSMFIQPVLRRPLAIAVMMMLAQQLTGINAIIFYSTDVFVDAGLSHEKAQFATIGLGLANLLTTVLAIFAIERAGRKTLLLVGLFGMLLATVGLFLCLVLSPGKNSVEKTEHSSVLALCSVASLVVYMVFFALGPGPIPWFLVSELFAHNSRPLATSMAVGVNWMANFCVSWAFQPITALIGPYVFVIFLSTMTFFLFYVWLYVPETKDKTILEITANFRGENTTSNNKRT